MDNENERRCINASDANIDDTFIDDTTQPGIGKSPELNFADELENWKIPLENLAKEIDMENERYEKEIEQLKDEKKVGIKFLILIAAKQIKSITCI